MARARPTASSTQLRIGASLVWQARQTSPAADVVLRAARLFVPSPSTTLITPSAGTRNVLSWLPYSSAFCAMSPTLGVVPIVVGSNAPCSRQNVTVSA